ncbi:hypothetical protein Ahy_A01g003246 [Arachis hypogaea]|uniref:Protein FAR1-RELATED SEQUENCE n=1 Tax=Arachis hypogaea TaxID=3818 RepID=A0A445ESG3_ARAHY|nr:hypothetical protein Ahy_A01g003246 [Arachis hypogaea]
MFVCRTIETNEEADIRPRKTYQSFVTIADSHRELSFIENNVRNYITWEVRNMSEQDDAKEFGNFWFICGRESPRSIETSRMRADEKRGHPIIQMAIRVLAPLHGREGTKRHSHRPMCIDAKGHRDVHVNNNLSLVHLEHHEEDPKQTKQLQATRRNGTKDEPRRLKLVHKESFDRNWNDFLTKYGLGGNKWLSDFGSVQLIGSVHSANLYEDRHIWILVYLDHHFWAGMRSTQRSESIHAFFNKFITHNNSLSQFVKQYDNCLASREQREREFDTANFYTIIPCATKSAIEAQFQYVYTHKKFREVQAQFRGKVNYITRSMHSTQGFTTYEVIEQVSNSTFNKYFITYDACLLFESRDILCCHSLSVLGFRKVDNVAPKYILERGTHTSRAAKTSLYWSRKARDSTIWCFGRTIYANLHLNPRSLLEFCTGHSTMSWPRCKNIMREAKKNVQATLSDVNDLQNPPRVKTRGRPKNRLGSNLNLLDGEPTIQPTSSFYNAPDMNYPGKEGSRWLRESYCFTCPNDLVSHFVQFVEDNVCTIFKPKSINLFLHFN